MLAPGHLWAFVLTSFALIAVGVQAIRHRTELTGLFGAIFLAIAPVSDSFWAIIAGAARSWFERSPRRLSHLGGTDSLVMIGIGARLALTGRKD